MARGINNKGKLIKQKFTQQSFPGMLDINSSNFAFGFAFICTCHSANVFFPYYRTFRKTNCGHASLELVQALMILNAESNSWSLSLGPVGTMSSGKKHFSELV